MRKFFLVMMSVLALTLSISAVPASATEDSTYIKIKSYPHNASVDTKGSLVDADEQFRELANFNPKGYNCDTRADTGKKTVSFNGNTIYLKARVTYQLCWPSHDNDLLWFVEPEYTRGSYNVEGSHMSCNGFLSHLTSLGVNMYFYRKSTGANFNPGEFNVPCDESTMNSVTQFYTHRQVPRLYIDADNTTPIAKVNWELRAWGPNAFRSHSWHFNP